MVMKPQMKKSALFRILSRMPKGALLHVHHNAMAPLEHIINCAIHTPGMYIYAISPLSTPEALSDLSVAVNFAYKPSQKPSYDMRRNIWQEAYTPGDLIPLDFASSTFPSPSGTPEHGFIQFVITRFRATADECLVHGLGIDWIWNRFQVGIRVFNTMIHNEPVFRLYLRSVFEELVADNIDWVEIRAIFRTQFLMEGRNEVTEGGEELDMASVFWDEKESFVKEMREKGIGNGFDVRIIWTGLRMWRYTDIMAGRSSRLCGIPFLLREVLCED